MLFFQESEVCQDLAALTSVLNMYINCGHLEEAISVFESIPSNLHKNSITYNSMLRGYTMNSQMGNALELFKKIPEKERDVITLNTLLRGCYRMKMPKEAIGIFEELTNMKGRKIKPNKSTWKLLLVSEG